MTKKSYEFFKRINYPIAGFCLVLIIGIFTLDCRPIVGMADSGDFFRAISSNGVYELNPNDPDLYNKYFYKDYGVYKYNNDNEKTYTSTQGIFIKAAIFISKIFNKSYILDIRFMSWMFLLAEAIGIYLIIKVLVNKNNNIKYRAIVTFITIFIFCDTGYLAYYNSFYGEAVNISFFLLSIGILLYMIEFKRFTKINIILYGVTSFIFFGAKQQLAPVGILVALVLMRILLIKKDKLTRALIIGLTIFITISAVMFYKAISGDFQYINMYHSMNRGILLYEDNPDEVMKYFNLNKQYSLLKETTFYDQVALLDLESNKLIEDYYKKLTMSKIVTYYATHPRAFMKVITISFENGYSIRPNYSGNYEKTENKLPGQKSYFFSIYSTLKEKIFSNNLLPSIIAIFIYVYISLKRYIKAYKIKDYNILLKEEAFFYVFLVGLSQIVISVIGAGDADLAKHVFMYNVTFDLLLIYIISIKFRDILEKKKEN